jgi:hypothetical protein
MSHAASHRVVSRRAWCCLIMAASLAGMAAAPSVAESATRYLSPSGADSGTCSSIVSACRSFDYAYRQSAPGDIVQVAAGSYGGQSIPIVSGRSLPAVEFRPAPGARPVLNGLNIDGSFVTVRGMRTGNVNIDAGSTIVQHATVVDGEGVSIWMNNVRNVTMRGGSFGGIANKQPVMVGAAPESHNVTFDGVEFHDATATRSDVHTECLMANNVQGLTIKNSLFRNCAYFGVLISSCCGGQLPPRDVLIESNVFERTYQWNTQGAPCSMMIGGVRIENLTFRNNTFQTGLCFSNTIHANTRMVGNLGAVGGCASGVTYAHNVWTSRTCSPTDRQASGLMNDFVNPDGHDWHLKAGAAAIDKASPTEYPPTDRDGKGRRGAPDAGAHEWGVADPAAPAPPGGETGESGGGGKALLRRARLTRKTICHRRTPTCRVTYAKLKVRAAAGGRVVVRIRRAGGKRKLVRTLRAPLRKRARVFRLDGRKLAPGRYRVTATVVSGGRRDRSRVLLLTVR